MNSAGKYAVAALLVMAIAGCAEKKAKSAPPVQAQAPTLDSGKAGAMYPPPLTQSPAQPEPPAPAPAPTVAETEPTPPPQPPPSNTGKTASKHKNKPPAAKTGPAPGASAPTGADATAATAATTQGSTPTSGQTEAPTDVATTAEPAADSPIGQLSTADSTGQTQTRKETVDLIANTENGLNGIKRTLNPQEQETVTQIKTFLIKAKTALSNEDLAGAFTLATKAKVLLDELNKT